MKITRKGKLDHVIKMLEILEKYSPKGIRATRWCALTISLNNILFQNYLSHLESHHLVKSSTIDYTHLRPVKTYTITEKGRDHLIEFKKTQNTLNLILALE